MISWESNQWFWGIMGSLNSTLWDMELQLTWNFDCLSPRSVDIVYLSLDEARFESEVLAS